MTYTLLLLNCAAFAVYGVDKYLAIRNHRRISEKKLLFLTLIGGSIGAILAQQLFHHKTQKFKYLLWIILLMHISILWLLIHPSVFLILI